jgi:hypothetical protein
MLLAEGLPKQVSERAVQFLGLAYLLGLERLSDKPPSVLDELVRELHRQRLGQLCWFFWTKRGDPSLPSEARKRVLEFWLEVTRVAREKGGDNSELRSFLNMLSAFIEEITDDMAAAWSEAAPYAQVVYHGHIMVAQLARLAPKFPHQSATILLSALEGFVPDFDPEDVVACVEAIAQAGCVEEAEGLCKRYGEKGSNILNETYKKLRSRTNRGEGKDSA